MTKGVGFGIFFALTIFFSLFDEPLDDEPVGVEAAGGLDGDEDASDFINGDCGAVVGGSTLTSTLVDLLTVGLLVLGPGL